MYREDETSPFYASEAAKETMTKEACTNAVFSSTLSLDTVK